jgi:hypothetical protein
MENIFWCNYYCLLFEGIVIPHCRQISRSASQGIWFAAGGAGMINNFKIKLGQELVPMGLSAI